MNIRQRMRERHDEYFKTTEHMLLRYPELLKELSSYIMDSGIKAQVITDLPKSKSTSSIMEQEIDKKAELFSQYNRLKRWYEFLTDEIGQLTIEEKIFIDIVREEKQKARKRRKIGRNNWRDGTRYRLGELDGKIAEIYPSCNRVSDWWMFIILNLTLSAIQKGLFNEK